MNAKIDKIEIHLPKQILSNDMLAEAYADWNSDKVEKRTGIRKRHIAAADETASDLGVRACEKLFTRVDKIAIDFLLFVTQSPDYYLPPSACVMQERLGLSTGIGALDIYLGCSGFVYGLATAKSLIAANVAANVLLVTSDTMSRHVYEKDRANRTIFGDGAAATLITASDESGIAEFVLGTDGSGYRNLIVPNGGIRNRYDPNAPEQDDGFGGLRTDNHLYMNGPEIFNFTIDAVPKVFRQTLDKNEITLDDLDYVIFHQANKYMVNYLRKKIGIPQEKFYMDLLETGNTVSATIPIGLKKSIDSGQLKSGDKVLIAGFGVGYSWGATVLTI